MIVVEASAIVDALVEEPVNAALLAVLAKEELHAPALLDFEVASALRGHVLGGLLDETRLHEAIDDFVGLSIQRHGMTAMLGHVLDLRDNFTVYDASNVVLAQALDAPLITTDDKLKEAERLDVVVQVVRPGAAG